MPRATPIRLRQIALVARDIKLARAQLEGAFGVKLVWSDPSVIEFGLENILYAVGGNALEVVAPVKSGTTAGRLLDKRGDGGYMLIFQGTDALVDRERVKKLGVRTVWEANRAHYLATHFHPSDTAGVFGIPSIDSVPGHDPRDEYSPWPPVFDRKEGPSRWLSIARAAPSSRLAYCGVAVQSAENPHMVASYWGRLLDLSVSIEGGVSTIRVDNLPIRFIKALDQRGNGIAVIDVGVEGESPRAVYDRACAAPGAIRGVVEGREAVMLVGVWWRFSEMPREARGRL